MRQRGIEKQDFLVPGVADACNRPASAGRGCRLAPAAAFSVQFPLQYDGIAPNSVSTCAVTSVAVRAARPPLQLGHGPA